MIRKGGGIFSRRPTLLRVRLRAKTKYSVEKAGNIGQQVTLTRIDCYRVTVMVEQNFLTVRPFSLNPDDHWIRAKSIFDMFYWRKAEISAGCTRAHEWGYLAIRFRSSTLNAKNLHWSLPFFLHAGRALSRARERQSRKWSDDTRRRGLSAVVIISVCVANFFFFSYIANCGKDFIITRNEAQLRLRKKWNGTERHIWSKQSRLLHPLLRLPFPACCSGTWGVKLHTGIFECGSRWSCFPGENKIIKACRWKQTSYLSRTSSITRVAPLVSTKRQS